MGAFFAFCYLTGICIFVLGVFHLLPKNVKQRIIQWADGE